MGQRGPAPKPAELRAIEGNRGHRPISLDSTFRPEVGAPDAPRWLTKEARKTWRRLMPELLRYNLVSVVDRDMLAMLCQSVGRIELLERAIAAKMAALAEDGKDSIEALVGKTQTGYEVQAVAYQLLSKEQEKAFKLLAEFGLSPAQRARVATAIRQQLTLFEGGKTEPTGGAPRGFAEFR